MSKCQRQQAKSYQLDILFSYPHIFHRRFFIPSPLSFLSLSLVNSRETIYMFLHFVFYRSSFRTSLIPCYKRVKYFSSEQSLQGRAFYSLFVRKSRLPLKRSVATILNQFSFDQISIFQLFWCFEESESHCSVIYCLLVYFLYYRIFGIRLI